MTISLGRAPPYHDTRMHLHFPLRLHLLFSSGLLFAIVATRQTCRDDYGALPEWARQGLARDGSRICDLSGNGGAVIQAPLAGDGTGRGVTESDRGGRERGFGPASSSYARCRWLCRDRS